MLCPSCSERNYEAVIYETVLFPVRGKNGMGARPAMGMRGEATAWLSMAPPQSRKTCSLVLTLPRPT